MDVTNRTCAICDRIFRVPAHLRRHQERKTPCAPIILNAPEAKTTCPHCGREFASRQSMQRHVRQTCKIANRDEEIVQVVNKNVQQQLEEQKQLVLDQQQMLLDQQQALIGLQSQVDKLIDFVKVIALNGIAPEPGPPPIKRKKIPLPLREAVWRKEFGIYMEGTCPVCNQNKISAMNFECGHVKADAAGGEAELDNMVPICAPCNRSMGATHLEDFKAAIWAGKEMLCKVEIEADGAEV